MRRYVARDCASAIRVAIMAMGERPERWERGIHDASFLYYGTNLYDMERYAVQAAKRILEEEVPR